MSQALHVEWTTSDQANASFKAAVVPYVRTMLEAGQRLGVTIAPIEDDRSLKQNAFYWGFCLKEISEQAQIGGIGADAEGWNRYYKVMFLGYRVGKTKMPGRKRPAITRELRSTRDLKVKAMSSYLDQVMAHAATTFGVTFPADVSWETYRGR